MELRGGGEYAAFPMPRRPRYQLTDFPLHVVQRGNDRRACFFDERDFRFYLKLLGEAAGRHRVLVHAYVLMTNHVHLLLTPLVVGGISKVMQSVGSRYVKAINKVSNKAGTLWESRYKACLVAHDRHVLAACRYIDLNPVRARMVEHASQYRWSSYGALAGTRVDMLVTPHAALEQLGSSPASYARWCEAGSDDSELDRLRYATEHELAFGSDAFKKQIEAMSNRATVARPSGPLPGFGKAT
jgi:putative transposase